MNLRFPALTALAMAVVAVSLPAHADLVITNPGTTPAPASAPVIVPAKVAPAPSGVIEFTAKPSNTITVRSGAQGASSSVTSATGVSSATIDRSQVLGYASAAPVSQGRVVQLGRESATASDLAAPVRGWAEQVPLEMALAQVVPSDWTIQARNVDIKRLVSWRGNRPWVEVLSDLTRDAKFNANVVWDRKVVVVFPPGALDGTAMAPLQSKPVVVEAPRPVVVAPMVPMAKVWKIDPRLTLRGNIEAWVKQAGWNTLVWEAADYPIVAPAVLEGEFTSPTGPLAKLIDAYRDSDQPLEVKLLTLDKVVHVTNKNFDAPTVAPLTPQAVVPGSFKP